MFLLMFVAAMSPARAADGRTPATTDATASTVFVVRHAERADTAPPGQPQPSLTAPPASGASMMSDADPGLSRPGRARAARLAKMLKTAGVARIFATEYARTRQTAAPLAAASGAAVETVAAKDVPGLLARLSQPGGPALVVGHSNTVPAILKGLGVQEPVHIGDAEYDNLFIVVRHAGGAQLVNLKFE